MIVDGHGRSVSYMRLSVTDRCNLSCFYCRTDPSKQVYTPHEDILTYEELLALAKAAQSMNVEKIRLTGGEPFARRDFLAFLGMLKEECPGLDVRVTTNATLLSGKAPALKHLGVTRINISLDTLDAEKFKNITGRDFYDRVRSAIDECLHYGLKVKINAVALKGFNDDEMPAFIDLARALPVDLRFIEFMPIGGCSSWDGKYTWPADEVLAEAQKHATLTPLEHNDRTGGPAKIYSIAGGKGRIGLISPMSNHFCNTCNRLRITSDGRLRTCLFSDKEYRLRPILRHPKLGADVALKVMQLAAQSKPLGYKLLESRLKMSSVCDKAMSSIGG